MKITFKIIALVAFGLTLGACNTPQEKLQKSEVKAVKSISDSEANVSDVREEEKKKISEAKGTDKVGDAKVEATENIAEAKKKVEDEKIDATKELVDAEQKVKTDPSPELP